MDSNLLNKLKNELKSLYEKDNLIKDLLLKVENNTATYEEADKFAVRVGEILAKVFGMNITKESIQSEKLTVEIAKLIIEPMLKNNHQIITETTLKIQKSLNDLAGIKLKVVKPKDDVMNNRINGLIKKVTSYDDLNDAMWVLDEPVVNFSQSVTTDILKENFDFHGKVGLGPVIKRIGVGEPCSWCSNLIGVYSYPDVPDDIYKRHKHCRCMVVYKPTKDGKVQDVWSKKWEQEEEFKARRIEDYKKNIEQKEKKQALDKAKRIEASKKYQEEESKKRIESKAKRIAKYK